MHQIQAEKNSARLAKQRVKPTRAARSSMIEKRAWLARKCRGLTLADRQVSTAAGASGVEGTCPGLMFGQIVQKGGRIEQ